jgi:hypothetical protein
MKRAIIEKDEERGGISKKTRNDVLLDRYIKSSQSRVICENPYVKLSSSSSSSSNVMNQKCLLSVNILSIIILEILDLISIHVFRFICKKSYNIIHHLISTLGSRRMPKFRDEPGYEFDIFVAEKGTPNLLDWIVSIFGVGGPQIIFVIAASNVNLKLIKHAKKNWVIFGMNTHVRQQQNENT